MKSEPDRGAPRRAVPPEADDAAERRPERPARPSLRSDNQAPVLVKEPPPLAVRLSQFLWVVSFLVGAVAIVYFFIVREDHLATIVDVIKAVDDSRPDDTYDVAADLVFWSAFAVMVGILLTQITLLVSFMNRRAGTRWWQFATLLVQAGLYALFLEAVGQGEQGEQLRRLMIGQTGLVALALLSSTLRPALTWTARQHDVRRGGFGPGGEM